jgi:hypothetical protein
LAKIRDVVDAIADLEERAKAIREIAIDKDMAEAIAKHFISK